VAASVPTEIRTQHDTNTSVEYQRSTNPLSGKGGGCSFSDSVFSLPYNTWDTAVVSKLDTRGLRGVQHSIDKTWSCPRVFPREILEMKVCLLSF
jgi:hypothetical protein